MYLPEHHREERMDILHAAIAAAPLATLVSAGEEGLEASHIPLLVDPHPAPHGALLGHFARANAQWKRIAPDQEVLAVFGGPGAYVSPSWYPSKRETGKAVPTWNYVTVHAYGRIALVEDETELRALLGRLTERHEGGRPDPWTLADAPEAYLRALLGAVVGFRMTVTRLEGKWKLSQNRSAADFAGVIAGLEAEGGPAPAAVAAAMRECGKP